MNFPNYLHLNIKVYGLVQGVFFRHSAREEAQKLKLSGFARNEADGSVYIEVEGEEKSLRKFLEWSYQGPSPAKVQKIKHQFETKIKGFKEFILE